MKYQTKTPGYNRRSSYKLFLLSLLSPRVLISIFTLTIALYPADRSWASSAAETCFIAKDAFGVLQPYMVTKSCFLFYHGANVDLRQQSEMVITRKETLHPDPIQAEFLRYVLERKLITLKKGTPIFSCDYDLTTVARDFKLSRNHGGETRALGYTLPTFNCAGTNSRWAPVRPVNQSRCYWVAVSLIRCIDFDAKLDPMSATGNSD